jgi:hypothetical protein
VQIQLASKLTLDQKEKLKAFILSKSKALVDKVSSSPLAITLHQGQEKTMKMLESALKSINAGTKAVGAKCYIVLEQWHVIEIKDWLLENFEAMHTAASQRAYKATSFVAGQERATAIFTSVSKRLPLVKIVFPSPASTGALSDASSASTPREGQQKTESSTGATRQVSEVVASEVEEDKPLP